MRNLACPLIAVLFGTFAELLSGAEAQGFKFGWEPPLTFTVVDSANVETTAPGTNSVGTVQMKYLIKFRPWGPGTNVLSWARAELLQADELRPGQPGFDQIAAPLSQLWASMPPLLINASGEPVGLVDSGAAAKAMGQIRERFVPGTGAEAEGEFAAVMSSPGGQRAMLLAISKIWNVWVAAWQWDQELDEIRELLAERVPGVVEAELLAPLMEGSELVPATVQYEFLGVETNDLVRLSLTSTFPISKRNGRSMGNWINSVALDDAKIDPADIEKMEFGKTTKLEAVVNPGTLLPSWVHSVEVTEAKDENGELRVKTETHEYQFNFSPSPDELHPGAAWSRQMHDKLERETKARNSPIQAVVGISVVLTVGTGIVIGAIRIMRAVGRRRKSKPSEVSRTQ